MSLGVYYNFDQAELCHEPNDSHWNKHNKWHLSSATGCDGASESHCSMNNHGFANNFDRNECNDRESNNLNAAQTLNRAVEYDDCMRMSIESTSSNSEEIDSNLGSLASAQQQETRSLACSTHSNVTGSMSLHISESLLPCKNSDNTAPFVDCCSDTLECLSLSDSKSALNDSAICSAMSTDDALTFHATNYRRFSSADQQHDETDCRSHLSEKFADASTEKAVNSKYCARESTLSIGANLLDQGDMLQLTEQVFYKLDLPIPYSKEDLNASELIVRTVTLKPLDADFQKVTDAFYASMDDKLRKIIEVT